MKFLPYFLTKKILFIYLIFYIQKAVAYNNPFIFDNNFYIINNFSNYANQDLANYDYSDVPFYSIDLIGNYKSKINNIDKKILGIKYFLNFQKFKLVIMPVFVNSNIKKETFGTDYERYGISARFETSFIQFNGDYISIKYGRGVSHEDYYPHHSIINSRLFPSYDELYFRFNSNNIKISFSLGQLSDEKNTDDLIIRRNIGSHKILWELTKKSKIEIGEMIIYTGENRAIEYIYSNPFLPYFLKGIESSRKNIINDNDNSMLFVNYKTKFNNYFNFYTEIIVDDYQVDETGKEHSLGMKVGLHNNQNNKNTWLIEYSKVNPWTYIHSGIHTSWVHRNNSMGHKYGPDNKWLNFQSNLNFNKYGLYIHIEYLEKGQNNLTTKWNNIGNEESYADNKQYLFSRISIIKNYKEITLDFGWSNFILPQNILQFEDQEKKGMVFLNFIYFFNKSNI